MQLPTFIMGTKNAPNLQKQLMKSIKTMLSIKPLNDKYLMWVKILSIEPEVA
jgi:hypothetical protein